MGMEFVHLTWLESIEPDEQPWRLEQRRLSHLVGAPLRVTGRLNDRRVIHRKLYLRY
jgi:hypothetical protein